MKKTLYILTSVCHIQHSTLHDIKCYMNNEQDRQMLLVFFCRHCIELCLIWGEKVKENVKEIPFDVSPSILEMP